MGNGIVLFLFDRNIPLVLHLLSFVWWLFVINSHRSINEIICFNLLM